MKLPSALILFWQECLQGLSSAGAGLWESGGRGCLEGVFPQSWSLSRKGHGEIFLLAPVSRAHDTLPCLTSSRRFPGCCDVYLGPVLLLSSLFFVTLSLSSFQCFPSMLFDIKGEGRKGMFPWNAEFDTTLTIWLERLIMWYVEQKEAGISVILKTTLFLYLIFEFKGLCGKKRVGF